MANVIFSDGGLSINIVRMLGSMFGGRISLFLTRDRNESSLAILYLAMVVPANVVVIVGETGRSYYCRDYRGEGYL